LLHCLILGIVIHNLKFCFFKRETQWGVSLWDSKRTTASVYQSLRVTPAMEAGITDHVWNLEEIVNLIN